MRGEMSLPASHSSDRMDLAEGHAHGHSLVPLLHPVACITLTLQVIFSEDFGTEGRGGYFDRWVAAWVYGPIPHVVVGCSQRVPTHAALPRCPCLVRMLHLCAFVQARELRGNRLVRTAAELSPPQPNSCRYGIIRDVIQNHLLQIVALFAMEPPVGGC